MDSKNILSEGALMSFIKGLFKGKKGLHRDIKKYTQENEFPDGKDYLLAMIYCNSRHGHGAEYIEVRQSEED